MKKKVIVMKTQFKKKNMGLKKVDFKDYCHYSSV